MPDILAAAEHAIAQGQAEHACRICAACVRVWMNFGYFAEGLAITKRALSLPTAETPPALRARAGAMLTLIRMSAQTADQTRMVEMCNEASALCHRIGDARGIWQVQHQRAWLRRSINPVEGWALHVALLEEARRKEDAHWIAIKLADLAVMSCYDFADHETVLRYTDEALALFEAVNDHWGMCYALITRGAALHALGRLDEALETLNHAQSLGAYMLPAQQAHLEDVMGTVCLAQKNFDVAVSHFAASVQLLRQIGPSFSQHSALANQGIAEVASRHTDDATQNLRRALAYFDGVPDGDPSSAVARCFIARCRIGLAHLAAHAERSDEAATLLREAQRVVDEYPTAFDGFMRSMLREAQDRIGP
jgi:tetratricopeptide (TPR) repeat protein